MRPPVTRPAAARPRGFTIIELMVVAAGLAILIALLIPSLLAALGEANSLRCRNRLNQIGLAYGRYVADSGGLWPPILTDDVPRKLLRQMEAETGLAMAPPRPAARWGRPGPHWSVVLWPYLRALDVYTCPGDPRAGLRGEAAIGPDQEHAVAFLDAPPESYALNVILFRTGDDLRRQAGCLWGTRGDVDYGGFQNCTTMAEQRALFASLGGRILFFCGASGQTVGSQFNIPLRTGGPVERWAWHPRRASAPFVDEPGCGSNYLFADGHVEYREELPGLWEWGYDLGPAPPPIEEPPADTSRPPETRGPPDQP